MRTIPEFEIASFETYASEHEYIVGFVDLLLLEVGFIVHRACVQRNVRGKDSDPGFLVCLPKRRRRLRDGSIDYTAIIMFPNRQRFFTFSGAVIDALQEMNPEAFMKPALSTSITSPQGVSQHV